MYSENFTNDCLIFLKAFISNQLAKFLPALYVKLTHQTGRGSDDENIQETTDYFYRCFYEYQERLGLSIDEFNKYLENRVILEYGPGDILGVALLLYAHGAKMVHCVDRFPLQKMTSKNISVYHCIIEKLSGLEKERARYAFKIPGNPSSGFNDSIINYSTTKNGLSGKIKKYDLIISRAVLEHVNDIDATFSDIKTSLAIHGKSIHKVDLKSHGLDRYQPFDFLTWPCFLYELMYSHKGFPNRWRVDKYIDAAKKNQLIVEKLFPTETLSKHEIDFIHPYIPTKFQAISKDQLGWLGFWMILQKN